VLELLIVDSAIAPAPGPPQAQAGHTAEGHRGPAPRPAGSPRGDGPPAADTFGYDDAGNREDPADLGLYDYDANNRITASPASVVYTFDADGNAAARTVGASSHSYTFDMGNRLWEIYIDGESTPSITYMRRRGCATTGFGITTRRLGGM
jgi:hypothetical protein